MSTELTQPQIAALQAYAAGALGAVDLRRRLHNATYGDVLRLLSEWDLPLPQASRRGREERLARAREWLFPAHEP
ncbi:MAG: hypothetical protein ABI306_01670 [Caulobacteraceae bacterium]